MAGSANLKIALLGNVLRRVEPVPAGAGEAAQGRDPSRGDEQEVGRPVGLALAADLETSNLDTSNSLWVFL